jgi:ketosteroid isomerase-like protein
VFSRFQVHRTASDGRRLQLAVACSYLIRDGRIAESRLFVDSSSMWAPPQQNDVE